MWRSTPPSARARLGSDDLNKGHEVREDLELLKASLAGEHFGIAAYDATIGSGLLSDDVVEVAQARNYLAGVHGHEVVSRPP